MMDRGGLAVHHLAGAHDLAAVDLADALVPEADAVDRNAAAKWRTTSMEMPSPAYRVRER